MKFLFKTILILLFSYLGQLLFPFWSIAIIALVISLFVKSKGFSSFFAGFLAVFLLWFSTAFIIDASTQSILTDKVASIFQVSGIVLMIITGVIGGLVGGFGSLTGSLLNTTFFETKRSGY